MKDDKPGSSVGKPLPGPEHFAVNIWLGPPVGSTRPPDLRALWAHIGRDSARMPPETRGPAGASGKIEDLCSLDSIKESTEVAKVCYLPPLRMVNTNPKHH